MGIQERKEREKRLRRNAIIKAAKKEALALYDELATADSGYKAIYDNWTAFKADSDKWFGTSETAYAKFVFGGN